MDQVDLRNGQDIVNIEHLDQKLWGALACPVENLEFDRRTLELLDTDKDLRIRAPEIIEITRWVKEVFKNPDDLVTGGDAVELGSINDASPAGAALLRTAKTVLATLGKEKSTSISLGDVSDSAKVFAATDFNGDGIIPASSASEESLRKVIEDIIATQGPLIDRSGKPGINQAKLDAFLAETAALLDWQSKGETDSAILPLGANTLRAAEALTVVRSKVDDFFTRCRLAQFDARYEAVLNVTETAFAPAANKELASNTEEISRLPAASVKAGRPLPLATGLNPAWSAAVAELRTAVVTPLLGEKSEITESEWDRIKATLAPFLAWSGAKPKTVVERLGFARLKEITALGVGPKIKPLIDRDANFGVAADQITAVEKLVRVKRDLFRLLNNFVSFSDFYARRGAIFQAGTLYLDSRSCDLCVHVADSGKHALLAGMARAYLAYLDCTRNGTKRVVAAAFTAGDSDQLMVGRNGVFYDRAGKDWDATITKVIENPISIRQAFMSPYKKLLRMIEEQIAKRAAAADSASQASLGDAATRIAELKPGEAAKAAPKKMDVGTVAALGVGLGSVGTFLALVFTKFVDLGWWAPLAVVGILLAISGPSVLIAYLKLRQRNLGPILDANGWAVNGRMRINVPFGGALSKRAKLPPGAEWTAIDPFGEKQFGRNMFILVAVLLVVGPICWRLHLLDRILPASLRAKPPTAQTTSTNAAPAAPAPAQ